MAAKADQTTVEVRNSIEQELIARCKGNLAAIETHLANLGELSPAKRRLVDSELNAIVSRVAKLQQALGKDL